MTEDTVNSTLSPDAAQALALAPSTPADLVRQAQERIASELAIYGERLEDLVHEARDARAQARPGKGMTTADVLADLPGARVMSSIPGRVRLRTRALKGQGELAGKTADILGAVPGVSEVAISPLTCSVLVVYDSAQYPSVDALWQALPKEQ